MLARLTGVLLIAASAVAAGLWSDYRAFEQRPIALSESSVILDIQRGTSLSALAREMSDAGMLPNPYYFMALAWRRGDVGRIKAGEFELTSEMTPADVLARITSGRVVQHPVTLVEGWTFRQALAVIDGHERFTGELGHLSDEDLMAQLGRPGQHPEGLFFPETYRFPRGTPRLEILRRSMIAMDEVLGQEWARRSPGLPIHTPYEALILASIIEKETGAPSERAEIAGVFTRRLFKGMRLQTDPTVIYGMGARYEGRIRRADLREATPYNTYVISGLPPTPIALPGRASIQAALNPAAGETLYFVSRGDGSHVFSTTLEEHNRAVRRYILGEE